MKDLPPDANILPSTWAFKVKRYPYGRLRKYKAGFVARGDRQIQGIDYGEKFSPVVSWTTVRMVMTLGIHLGWETKKIDFSNDFVQADLKEEVYLTLPPGFSSENGTIHETVLKLRKSVYGLVQAPKVWNDHLTQTMINLG